MVTKDAYQQIYLIYKTLYTYFFAIFINVKSFLSETIFGN